MAVEFPDHVHPWREAKWRDHETGESQTGAHCPRCGLTVPVGCFFNLPPCQPAPAEPEASSAALRAVVMTTEAEPLAADLLEGAEAIAAFLGGKWNARRVYNARERGQLPIRHRPGMGLYAFRSELRAALTAPETLVA